MRTQAVCKASKCWLNVCNFQQRLLFAYPSNHRYNNGAQISAWQTVHEPIVVDTFHSKKSSPVLLVYKLQVSQKWCFSSRHSTACGNYKKNIYGNTGSVQSV